MPANASPSCLLFLHIPKTAGSSMRSILELNYGKNEWFLAREMWKGNPNFHALPEEKRKQLRLVMGHQAFGLHTAIGERSFEYFTLLRDPVDRIMSLYYHILRNREHPLYGEFQREKYTLADVLHKQLSPAYDNCQVRMLAGAMDVPYGGITETHYHTAIENLEKHIPLAGLQNRFDEFVLLLADRYRWRLPYYRRFKVGGNRIAKSALDAETTALIRAHNAWDERLLAYVTVRFEKQVAAQGPGFPARVKRYAKRNRLFEKFVNALPWVKKPHD